MIIVKTPAELDAMRASGRAVARVRDALVRAVRPGVTTAELDACARDLMAAEGAVSAFRGYRGFPGHICVSINDEVVHGIPGPRRVAVGDLVSLDVGVILDGFVGDTATTVLVGVADPEAIRLAHTAEAALETAVSRAVDGGRLSDISHAIERTALDAGFSVVRDFVGHGIGRSMHEDPQIPNFGPPGRGPRLRPGMTLAIEPMLNMGRAEVDVMQDGWTVLTRDGRPSVHFEHTVAVGPGGPEVLTLPVAEAVAR